MLVTSISSLLIPLARLVDSLVSTLEPFPPEVRKNWVLALVPMNRNTSGCWTCRIRKKGVRAYRNYPSTIDLYN